MPASSSCPPTRRSGAPASEAIRVEGPVIEVAVTPNRSDCFGVLGIARELAAAGLGELKSRDFTPVPGAFAAGAADHARLSRGRRGGLPAVRRPRLPRRAQRAEPGLAAGAPDGDRAAADLGPGRHHQPRHLGPRPAAARVRRRPSCAATSSCASRGPASELLALDGNTYELDPAMTVIADDSGAISLGGIMGGESTGCTAATTDVVLEIALFDPMRTAATGRRLGIESDARTRFERGVDPAHGAAGHGIRDPADPRAVRRRGRARRSWPGALPAPPRPFRFRLEQLKRLAGIALEPRGRSKAICARSASASRGGPSRRWRVTPPTWRHDVTMEADVVEELVPPARLRPHAADAGAAHRGGRPSDAHARAALPLGRAAQRSPIAASPRRSPGRSSSRSWPSRFGGGRAGACATRSTPSCRCCARACCRTC